VEVAIKMVRERENKRLLQLTTLRVEDHVLDLIVGKENDTDVHAKALREEFRKMLQHGDIEDVEIHYDLKTPKPTAGKKDMQTMLNDLYQYHQRVKKSRYSIKEIRRSIQEQEIQKVLSDESIIQRAITETQEYGIVFIDELDKIVRPTYRYQGDASDEGVQRDLLPLIEGTQIATNYGDVDTSKILFITAGAFHHSKPSDLLAELQGRLPIRVMLHALTEDDMYRILTEPQSHGIRQQRALLRTEDVDLRFTDDAIRAISKIASEVNQTIENIGARRLHTILEKVLEDISFNARNFKGKTVIIDKSDVEERLKDFTKKTDLKKFIL